MLRDYADITGPLGAPRWYDGQGVPRYCAFHPEHCGVYDRAVVLFEIACQACGAEFVVAHEAGSIEPSRYKVPPPTDRAQLAEWLHWGDPPRHCDGAGDTMNSVPLRVLEWWYRPSLGDWTRQPEYEGKLVCAWATEDGDDAALGGEDGGDGDE